MLEFAQYHAYKNRQPRVIEHLGRTMTVQEWAKELDISASLIHQRLSKGWTEEAALTTPKMKSIALRSVVIVDDPGGVARACLELVSRADNQKAAAAAVIDLLKPLFEPGPFPAVPSAP